MTGFSLSRLYVVFRSISSMWCTIRSLLQCRPMKLLSCLQMTIWMWWMRRWCSTLSFCGPSTTWPTGRSTWPSCWFTSSCRCCLRRSGTFKMHCSGTLSAHLASLNHCRKCAVFSHHYSVSTLLAMQTAVPARPFLSVRPSICLPFHHTPVLFPDEWRYNHAIFSIW